MLNLNFEKKISLIFLIVLIHFNNSIEGSFREDDYTYDNDDDLVYQPQQHQVQEESLMRNDEIGSITTTNTALLTTDPMPPTYSSSLGQELLMNCRTTSECKDLFDKIILKQMVRNDRQQKNTKKFNFYNSIWAKK